MAKKSKIKTPVVEIPQEPRVYEARCMSEGGARVMMNYIQDKQGHTIVGLETPPEGDVWYTIKYMKAGELAAAS